MYLYKNRTEILCKYPCRVARYLFLDLISLVNPGTIEPWPECQPEEARPREARGEESRVYIYIWWPTEWPRGVQPGIAKPGCTPPAYNARVYINILVVLYSTE